jgi:hypothetical protein
MKNLNYVLERITSSKITSAPWEHLVIDKFLPENLYEDVKKEISIYTSNQQLKKNNVRAYHIYVNASVNVYPNTPALKEYYDILLNPAVVNSIREKLSLILQPYPEDFYSELNLFTQGYVYDEIHPDRSDKLITMLHYLAEDDDDRSLGTFLYSPLVDGKNLDVYKDQLASTPYIANCVLLFAPKDTKEYKTNHCMGNKSEKTFLRKSFQTFWIKEQADWTNDRQSGRVRL